jgi:TRAP-type C4-dicarboxylate transport system permease small subunit
VAQPLRKIWKFVDIPLSWVETITVLGLLTAVLVISFFQIVARPFGGGWIWADELVRYMVLWLGIFGAGPATRHHKHLAIDAVQQFMPPVPRLWVRRLVDLVAAAVALIFVKAIVDYIGFVGDERSTTLGVTVGTLTWPIAVGFSWISLRFFADAVLGVEFDNDHTPMPLIQEDDYEESMRDRHEESPS